MAITPTLTFSPLWEELMKVGRKIEREEEGIAHSMTEKQLYDVFSTIDYIVPGGVPDPMRLNAQWDFDMKRAKYRLFDELGMALGGRLGEDKETIGWAKKLSESYITCVKESGVKARRELYDCVPREALKVE